ncbi:hypothetical protein N752_09060 [Desulforamulus aquiferis]|nr:hypothetical protein N752_09060 [Desulforamulus aquiferis]
MGKDGYQIEEAALTQGFEHILKAKDYEHAVELAHNHARSGEVVLLSPACTSWDMFKTLRSEEIYLRNLF